MAGMSEAGFNFARMVVIDSNSGDRELLNGKPGTILFYCQPKDVAQLSMGAVYEVPYGGGRLRFALSRARFDNEGFAYIDTVLADDTVLE